MVLLVDIIEQSEEVVAGVVVKFEEGNEQADMKMIAEVALEESLADMRKEESQG